MPTIIYIDHEGTERQTEGKSGETVMEVAIKHSIPGIDAECGGACACATCHIYVDKSFMPKVGQPEEMEQAMLDFAEGANETSRLSCQISITDKLDGLRVTTPESQF